MKHSPFRTVLRNRLSGWLGRLARKLDRWSEDVAVCERCGRNPYYETPCYEVTP